MILQQKDYEHLEFGMINYNHPFGTTYITKREKKHIFLKYKAFGISVSEISKIIQKNCKWILIIYKNNNEEEIPHRIRTEDIEYLQRYNNEGDINILFPIDSMQKRMVGETQWKY